MKFDPPGKPMDLRAQFAPRAARFREDSKQVRRNIHWIVFLQFLAIGLAFVVKAPPFVLIAVFLAMLGFLIRAFRSANRSGPAACPSCGTNLFYLHYYCPDCGGRFETMEWRLAPTCSQCRKRLWNGRNPNYLVRYCTGCGSHLDGEGLRW